MEFELTHGNRILTLTSASEIEIDQLNESLKKRISTWKWDPRVQKGWWDGYISYFKNNRYAPAGLWMEIIEMCKMFKYDIRINGLSGLFDQKISFDDFEKWANDKFKNHKINPYDYQIKTAYDIIRYKSCLAELATSAGKTVIIYLIIAYLLETNKSNKILMIVPNVDLVLQASEDILDYNEGNDLNIEIQQIYAGAKIKKSSNVVIGTYQSLVKRKKPFYMPFDTAVVDECLHPETKILMSDLSEKNIKDVKIGDSVKTINDKTKEIEDNIVDFVYENLSVGEDMYEIELENGKSIKITGNHKVKLSNGIWKRVDELLIDDDIMTIEDD